MERHRQARRLATLEPVFSWRRRHASPRKRRVKILVREHQQGLIRPITAVRRQIGEWVDGGIRSNRSGPSWTTLLRLGGL